MTSPNTSLQFPDGFLWGAATSSHQIEGQNHLNDWWAWEAAGKVEERSGQACDSYRRYEEDFDIAKSLHHNSHRFSIEWSRIALSANEWNDAELSHYTRLLASLKARGLEPLVTLHHFTLPQWLAAQGGWANPKSVDYFVAYTERVVQALGGEVRFWITINEPLIYLFHGYVAGLWPPGKQTGFTCHRVIAHLAQAHIQAYARIHALYAKNQWSKPAVSIAHAISVLDPANPQSRLDRLAVKWRSFLINKLFLKLIQHEASYWPAALFGCGGAKRTMDFIGVNYYFREIIQACVGKKGLACFIGEPIKADPRYKLAAKSDLGWEIYPEGIYRAIKSLRGFKLPIYITENGICTSDDALRWKFIKVHLEQIHRAISEGIDVRGYQYWSLVDNFEWAFGFKPRFGLVQVNFESFKRQARPSAKRYADVCRTNQLNMRLS